MQAVREGGASRVAVQLVGGAGAGDRRRDAAGSPEAQEPRTPDRDESEPTLAGQGKRKKERKHTNQGRDGRTARRHLSLIHI